MSHISLPQTSVSVDSYEVTEKSKNYHNWTSSASYDVCAPVFLIFVVRSSPTKIQSNYCLKLLLYIIVIWCIIAIYISVIVHISAAIHVTSTATTIKTARIAAKAAGIGCTHGSCRLCPVC